MTKSSVQEGEDMDSLRSKWSKLYSQDLPRLARAKDSAQPRWPVTLDHCFARIILDNTVGRGVIQWDNVIKKPAVKNMDEKQLKEAIELAQKIRRGEVDLVELDQNSLQARGKQQKKYGTEKKKRDRADDAGKEEESVANAAMPGPSPKKPKMQSTLSFSKDTAHPSSDNSLQTTPSSPSSSKSKTSGSFSNPNTAEFLEKIQNHHGLTPYRKRLYSTLLSVPPGQHTTYQAMATFLSSSARAVGNGMRNNPYAPDVPCHRVLASDGSIGGFHGSWGEEGKYASDKIRLLKGEGVTFDSRGKVKGPVFSGFEDLSRRSEAVSEAV